MEKKDVRSSLIGGNRMCRQYSMGEGGQQRIQMIFHKLSFDRNIPSYENLCVRYWKFDNVTCILQWHVLKDFLWRIGALPSLLVRLCPTELGVRIVLNEKSIFLPLEREAINYVHSAIIALSEISILKGQTKTNADLLEREKAYIEVLKKQFFDSWTQKGSLKSKRGSVELITPGPNLEEDWTPQKIAELFGGGVNAAMVRYYARKLAKIPAQHHTADFDKNSPGEPQTWNSAQKRRLVDYMNKYCPTVKKMNAKKNRQRFDNTHTG